jgi:hypothetical protein
MTDNGIRWRLMARIRRDTMSEKDRRQLDRALAALAGKPPARWPRRKVVRVGGESGRYMLILPRGIRAFDDRHGSAADYVAFMRPRYRELARVLEPTGSLYYHCDHHPSHQARQMLDELPHFRSEIVFTIVAGCLR